MLVFDNFTGDSLLGLIDRCTIGGEGGNRRSGGGEGGAGKGGTPTLWLFCLCY